MVQVGVSAKVGGCEIYHRRE